MRFPEFQWRAAGILAEYAEYVSREKGWLPDYALFMAVKKHFGDGPWMQWPEDIRLRRAGAVEKYREELKDEIDYHCFVQMLFFRQWEALREYAHRNGVQFIGDIPIYVALDSADVWSEPQFFLLDENNPLLYLAQTDGAGYKTITTFKIEPFTPEPQVDSKSLEERIKKLEEAIYNGRESDTADARRNKKSSAAGTEHITE